MLCCGPCALQRLEKKKQEVSWRPDWSLFCVLHACVPDLTGLVAYGNFLGKYGTDEWGCFEFCCVPCNYHEEMNPAPSTADSLQGQQDSPTGGLLTKQPLSITF